MVKNCLFLCPIPYQLIQPQYSTFAPLSKRSDDKFLKGKWLVKTHLNIRLFFTNPPQENIITLQRNQKQNGAHLLITITCQFPQSGNKSEKLKKEEL